VRVAGVDGCRAGWVAVVLDDDDPPTGVVRPTFDALLAAIGPCRCIAVDMPIGFPAPGLGRAADRQAQELLGPARSRVFPTPPRDALLAPDYAAARMLEPSLSAQSYALRGKILELDASGPPAGVIEVHPDLAFALLAGEPLAPKKGWSGFARRRALLAASAVALPEALAGGDAGVDDVVDAAGCALVARLHVAGRTRALGDPAVGVIWVPALEDGPG
jgi:predicted RNase H-like nuclease